MVVNIYQVLISLLASIAVIVLLITKYSTDTFFAQILACFRVIVKFSGLDMKQALRPYPIAILRIALVSIAMVYLYIILT